MKKKKTEKLTIESFLEKLKSDGYMNGLTAKRALGKAQGLSGADRDRARAAIDKHYGTQPTPAKKVVAKDKVPKKAVLSKSPIPQVKKAFLAKKVTLRGDRHPGARQGDLVRYAQGDSDYTAIQPAAKAPLTYDLHQKMSLTVQSIQNGTSGLNSLLQVQTALDKSGPLQPGEFQLMLVTGARMIHRANVLGHRNLDEVLGEEQVGEVVGPEEAGIDRPRRALPRHLPTSDNKEARAPDPGSKHASSASRVPVSERGIGERAEAISDVLDEIELAEEPLASNGRELFRNSHPAKGA